MTNPDPTPIQLKYRDVQTELVLKGIILRWKSETEEYRVNFRGGREATAYYTNDLEDARNTGLAMADRRDSMEKNGSAEYPYDTNYPE